MNKKGLSPLVATILLVFFALVLGAVTMNFGRAIVEDTPAIEEVPTGNSYTISAESIDNELKEIQIDYLLGRLTLEEYLEKEREVLQSLE